jgi:predicted transcriptional regulator
MTITFSSELEERLRESAAQRGEDPAATAEALLRFALSWEEADRLEAIEGIRRGIESSEAGRVLPAAEVFAKMRAKLNPSQ